MIIVLCDNKKALCRPSLYVINNVCYQAFLIVVLGFIISKSSVHYCSWDYVKNCLLVTAASMVNQISCNNNSSDSAVQQLTSDAVIEVWLTYDPMSRTAEMNRFHVFLLPSSYVL